MNGSLSRRRLLALGAQGVTASFVLAACSSTAPGSSDDPAALVSDADMTLNNFLRDPEMTWFRDNLPSARGVLIVPTNSCGPASSSVAPAAMGRCWSATIRATGAIRPSTRWHPAAWAFRAGRRSRK